MHSGNSSIAKFLSHELSGISGSTAANIVTQLNHQLQSNSRKGEVACLSELDTKGVTILSQILRDFNQIKPPTHVLSTGMMDID